MDQFLHWNSHHTISSKYSVVATRHHRSKTICSNNHLLQQEEDHLSEALMNCYYPIWALNRVKMMINNNQPKRRETKTNTTQQNNIPKPYITVPYYKGLGESVKKKCSNYGVQVYFKGGITIQKPPGGLKRTKILC